MLSNIPNFIFYIESNIINNNNLIKDYLNFINKVPLENCYFFTHNCDISRKSLYKIIKSKNLNCYFDNVFTPTYFLLEYCKNLYDKFTIYPISSTKDFNDFFIQNIQIDENNPDLIFISNSNINDNDLKIINKFNVPIVFSSNLCINRFHNCVMCNYNCSLKYIRTFYKNRLIIPDLPPVYNTVHLFKRLSIETKNTIVVTDYLRDDYIQFQKNGCKLILLLSNKFKFDDYIKSPYDADIVVNSFENLSYFLNLKEEA
ncbi:hypothetical protein CTM_03079 [Clostridium tetanomorphum DSM 665]|uniref:Uncharacterized protein n=1 Tax=Clostridium tetanomorphum TaxID=1553 RepID=A0A923EAG6_CLOTT|nr:hypothetical protein [Clostridium tetanomorphum]KAJ53240.1 hypothetical protein CTM_03079 [Clostridium tetanomorphum DSM 665]MBC2399463.1 hypothetical protein [Clostridium tetanomorphum]MBP1865728.1 ribonucleotide monophosphatase NagD (HAD superfamily) [Clostridium tetanomorphum]NRZ99394.1 ribonucleotide monophosphatase NagD (HAD superfamily) [Clostridium tetanomorphum]SQC00352.1 Glycerol dehydrogenase and related enzymes [Clostridium tetanomorphum]